MCSLWKHNPPKNDPFFWKLWKPEVSRHKTTQVFDNFNITLFFYISHDYKSFRQFRQFQQWKPIFSRSPNFLLLFYYPTPTQRKNTPPPKKFFRFLFFSYLRVVLLYSRRGVWLKEVACPTCFFSFFFFNIFPTFVVQINLNCPREE